MAPKFSLSRRDAAGAKRLMPLASSLTAIVDPRLPDPDIERLREERVSTRADSDLLLMYISFPQHAAGEITSPLCTRLRASKQSLTINFCW